ncbi:MAG: hypothetical protein KJN98_07070 [Pontiella sp.]|nr:hypothetical protein [Pontiella sp.]
MMNRFETDYIGKHNLNSHFSRCIGCNRLTRLYSYDTRRFVKFSNFPLVPLKTYHVLDECPHCGQRGITTKRKFAKERKSNLAEMMAGFADDADNPDNCTRALHTLMIYNEASWFDDMHESYGLRFDAHPQIQHIIAQGLCRFGDYEDAITHCRKAIVLGAGKAAEELMDFCHTLLEAKESRSGLMEEHHIHPESAKLAYIPANTVVAALLIALTVQGVSSLRTYHAWLVNGSLQEYSFTLDGETYTLAPGNRRQIKLKLGKHELQVGAKPAIEFNYTISFAKQLIEKNLLVINPDSMALLTMEKDTDGNEEICYSFGKLLHELADVGYPLMGFGKSESEEQSDRVGLFRPPTHAAMIERLRQLDLPGAAPAYARKALLMDPSSDEADVILDTALEDLSVQEKLDFLKLGTRQTPPLLAWHQRYINLVLLTQPEHSLIRDYSLQCKNNPEEPIYYYLLAQAVAKRNVAHQFFNRSENGKGMGGRGFYAVARDQFAHAEYKDALASCGKALEKDPDNRRFTLLRNEALLALRRFDDLLSGSVSAEPEKKILYLTKAGYHQEAEAEAVRLSEEQGLSLPRLNAIRFYAVGNLDDYHASLTDAGDAHVVLEMLLHKNRLEEADQMLSTSENTLWWEHLVLYCAAMQAKKTGLAERNLEQAVREMHADTKAYQLTARHLTDDQAPEPDMVRALDLEAHEKALLCAALGYRFPDQTLVWMRLGKTYNYYPAYPQRLLNKWFKEAAKTGRKASVMKPVFADSHESDQPTVR